MERFGENVLGILVFGYFIFTLSLILIWLGSNMLSTDEWKCTKTVIDPVDITDVSCVEYTKIPGWKKQDEK